MNRNNVENNVRKQQKYAAIIGQSLYLANLLLFPVISFTVLLVLFRKRTSNKGLGYQHQIRAIQLSILAGIFLVLIPGGYLLLQNNMAQPLMILLLYFIILHVIFVLLGMVNLSRAMSMKPPFF